MPKRRMRTAKQIAASKRNLEKARKAKSRKATQEPRKKPKVIDRFQYLNGPDAKIIPTGKNTLLYHRTRSTSADAIVKSRKWISGAREFSGRRGYSWFSMGGPTGASGFYGNALLTVSVPRKAVQKVGYNRQDGVEFVQVKNSVLKGRKVRRVH